MSLYYEHHLVARPANFRPEAETVARFLRMLNDEGYVPEGAQLSFVPVIQQEPVTIQRADPFSGRTMSIPGRSRRRGKPVTCKSDDDLLSQTANASEYDAVLDAEGLPQRPPMLVGYVEGDNWKPLDEPYALKVRCCIRSRIVRLFSHRSPEDFTKILDPFNMPAHLFDEDCSEDESTGWFLHPETGPISIANAGCATFWIELCYGKFLFPLTRDGSLDVLDDELRGRTEEIFGTAFVQACHWG